MKEPDRHRFLPPLRPSGCGDLLDRTKGWAPSPDGIPMPEAVKKAFAFSFPAAIISPSFTEACPEASQPLCGIFDVPLSRDPRTEPPTDVAGSEVLLRIVAGESIVSAYAIDRLSPRSA